MKRIPIGKARKFEDDGETLWCLRCGKPTSTYPRDYPASGEEQAHECMCCGPQYSIAED